MQSCNQFSPISNVHVSQSQAHKPAFVALLVIKFAVKQIKKFLLSACGFVKL